MAAVITSPEDVVNLTLQRIGYPLRIGSLYEGSKAAKAALDLYSQTRDQLIMEGDFEFAIRLVNGSVLKTAPPGGYIANPWTSAYPPPPWNYEYAYPADCLKVRALKTPPVLLPNATPRYYRFEEANDNSLNPPQKVILANIASAMIVYAGQVTDPTTWNQLFVEAMAASLGRRLGPALMGPDSAKMEAQDEETETAIAMTVKG